MSGRVTIVGLGPGDVNYMTLGAYNALKNSDIVLLRTERHPTEAYLQQNGIVYEALDRFYERYQTFQDVYKAITDYVVDKAAETQVCYAVPGDPWVGESTTALVKYACEERGIAVDVLSGTSFMEPLFAAAGVDPFDGLAILDATLLHKEDLYPWQGTLIAQVYNRFVAAELKLALMEAYPPEHGIVVISGAGTREQSIHQCPLYELDHEGVPLNHLTTIYLPPVPGYRRGCSPAPGGSLPWLVEVMAKLRSPEGCPWDIEQDHKSLRPYVIEEAYEVVEAIDSGKVDKLVEELGDLLLQVVFHCQVGSDADEFDISDVIRSIAEKLIRRHPHVFGDVQVEGSADVLVNWERIKRSEHGNQDRKSILDGIPVALPSLMRAEKIQSKAAKVGFEWDDVDGAVEKVWEEVEEFRSAYETRSKEKIEDEMGDIFFALVNVARYLSIDPEFALKRTIEKFDRRFRFIEEKGASQNRSLEKMTLQEMDELWNEAKLLER